MATSPSCYLFLFLLFAETLCSSGTLVGFYYDARKPNSISSAAETLSILKLNKINPAQIRVFVEDFRVLDSSLLTNVDVDLYLNDIHSALSSLKSYLLTSLSHVRIRNIILSSTRTKENELTLLLSSLKSVHSMVESFSLDRELKVSAEFSLSLLENLSRGNKKNERDLKRIFEFMNKIRSFVTIEGELNNGDKDIEAVVKRANSAISALSSSNLSVVLIIKNSVFSTEELDRLSVKISQVLETIEPTNAKKINHLFVEANLVSDFKSNEKIFSFRRELLTSLETTEYDANNPPTNTLPSNPTPTIITVTPKPINNTPVTVPSSTAVPVPLTNPAAVPVPVTNPAAVPVPLTNPVTTPTAVPTPVTNPVTTPSTVPQPVTNPVTNNPVPAGGAPATGSSPGGQSWCIAKNGASQSALQAALDYACGIGGIDCSVINQGGSCYNPISLQSHASYAFNSYYQKNPVPTSCDFGGTAMVTTSNPSSGSCIFLSSASSSSSSSSSSSPGNTLPTPMPTTTSPTPMPVVTTPPTSILPPPITQPSAPMPQTPPSSGDMPGYGIPPSVLNSSNPASGTAIYGDGPPSVNNTSTISTSNRFFPSFGHIIILTLFIAGKFVLDI